MAGVLQVRRYGWRALLVLAVTAVVYIAGISGNGFWGYADASEISGAECTVSTLGIETCVTRFCEEAEGGTTRCTTYTQTCQPANTHGQRPCYTEQTKQVCGTDKTACQPIGAPGTCSTSSDGVEHCVSRTCRVDDDRRTCQVFNVYCTSPNTSGTRSCSYYTYRETCSTDPRSCAGPQQIVGRVADREGDPIEGATVEIFDGTGTEVFETSTGADGRYAARELPGYSYRARFSADGFRTEWWENRRTMETADQIRIFPGNIATADARLATPVGRIVGRVLDRDRQPLEGATAEVLDAEGAVVASGAADATGRYVVRRLAPGTYRVRFTAAGYVTEYFHNVATLGAATPVEVAADTATAASARLRPSSP